MLEIEFIDNGSKIIVNSQAPMKEMWVAARSGGFHYKRVGDEWRNTRDGSEFFAALSDVATEQGGAPSHAVVVISADLNAVSRTERPMTDAFEHGSQNNSFLTASCWPSAAPAAGVVPTSSACTPVPGGFSA